MDWDKVKEFWDTDIYDKRDVEAMTDAFEEMMRQHLAEHHAEFTEHFLDNRRHNKLPYPLTNDDPSMRLSRTMEPERCECDVDNANLIRRDQDVVDGNPCFIFLDKNGDEYWVKANYCAQCGKPLAGKEAGR